MSKHLGYRGRRWLDGSLQDGRLASSHGSGSHDTLLPAAREAALTCIEDWTAAPEADDAYPGLRGQPWHLNVLGVTLHATPVRRILFRDLDTPAAPVLVAVTMEK